MKLAVRSNNAARRIHLDRRWSLCALFVLVPFLSACQEASFVNSNPLFIQYVLEKPTMSVGTGRIVVLQRIAYKDIDKETVDYGDDIVPSKRRQIWEFRSAKLVRINVETSNELGVFVAPEMTVDYPKGRIVVTNYTDQKKQLIDEYGTSEHSIASTSTRGAGQLGGYLEIGDGVYRYWDSTGNHQKRPDGPDMECTVVGNTVQITRWMVSRAIAWRLTYVDGILMRNERGNGRISTYSTPSGLGEVVISDTTGKVTERWQLERTTDGSGRLVREKVRRADGTGYIYTIERGQ